MLTIDLTAEVASEAVQKSADFIVAYHPPIFRPVHRLVDGPGPEGAAWKVASVGAAIYSPHTALDAAPGGLNDFLAESVDPEVVRPLQPCITDQGAADRKLVTFCPRDSVNALREALDRAGAGRIGRYALCSFEISGTGTFYGGSGANPAVGKSGRLERVDEVRLEMVCPASAIPGAVDAIRQAHPYEEAPIDVYVLSTHQDPRCGGGRIATLRKAIGSRSLIASVKRHLGVKSLQCSLSTANHRIIGFCAGAGSGLLDAAIHAGCTAFVTGEMRHHEVLRARSRGCDVILAGHTNTERPYLPRLKQHLLKHLGGNVAISISKADRDPLSLK